MMNIFIYNGPNKAFNKYIPKDNLTNFLDFIRSHDKENRRLMVVVKGQEDEYCDEVEEIENLIIHSTDYSSVAEHVIENFINFLRQYKINNLYIQNPPMRILTKILQGYNKVKIQNFKYETININKLKDIKENFFKRIIGQEEVKEQLLSALYPLTKKDNTKPVVIMFYGPSGVGKTETAKYIGEILKGKILRKQFSMFQNNDFSTYLFGGKYSQGSFTKDLLERESNVILLDEFDKSHSVFHSAFYEFFDEGIMEDKNYKADVKNSVIICTSNYKSIEDIRKSLGDPIYSRFDAVIRFNKLDIKSIHEIIHREYNCEFNKLSENEQYIVKKYDIELKLIINANKFTNVREIKVNIKNMIYLVITREIL